MPLTNVNGVDLFYEESGTGEPIIFQHGYTGAHESWDDVIERMRDRLPLRRDGRARRR